VILASALDIIEENLRAPLRLEDLARACYSSPSGLQKLFRYVFRYTVSEYTSKRRLTRASAELAGSDRSILAIALDYQYNSAEAFSRAFKRFWGISPSIFRRERRFTALFPRFQLEYVNGGYVMPSSSRRVDIRDLYDVLKGLANTYMLCVDVRYLMQINEQYGHRAGDMVIAETAARIEREISPTMLMFRVGGDEFAVVTGYDDPADVEALRERIATYNGQTIDCEGQEIPVSTRYGIYQIPEGNIRYSELYGSLVQSLWKPST
jgi:AraC family transcriptional regulator